VSIYDSGIGDLRLNVKIIVYLCLCPNCISNLAWSVIKVTCNIVERYNNKLYMVRYVDFGNAEQQLARRERGGGGGGGGGGG